MEYYDCKNNILNDINQQGLLTSGYMSDQFNANKEPVVKPTNVAKCSHGSVMDKTSHRPAVGAVDATERFFNDLRKDLGDTDFDRLFAINPTKKQLQTAEISIENNQKFHFLSSTLSIGLSSDDVNFSKTIKERIQNILSLLFNVQNANAPTYDLSGIGIDKSNGNIHAAPLLIDNSKTGKKRRRFISRQHF